jgi:hypothetical protein
MPNIYPTGIGTTPIDFSSAGLNFFHSTVDQRLKDIDQKHVIADKSEKAILKAMSIQALPEMSSAMRDRYQVKLKDFRDKIIQTHIDKQGQLTMDDNKFREGRAIELQNEMNFKKNQIDKYAELQKFIPTTAFDKTIGDKNSFLSEVASWKKRFEKGDDVEDPMGLIFKYRKEETPLEYLIGNSPKEIANLDLLTQKKVDESEKQIVITKEIQEKAVEDLFANKFDSDPAFKSKFFLRDENGSPILENGKPTIDIEKMKSELQNTKDALIKKEKTEDEYSFRNLMTSERRARRVGTSGERAFWGEGGIVGVVKADKAFAHKGVGEIMGGTAPMFDALTGKKIDMKKGKKGTIYSTRMINGVPFMSVKMEGGGWAADKEGNIFYAEDKDVAYDKGDRDYYYTDIETNHESQIEFLKESAKNKGAVIEDVDVKKNKDGSLTVSGNAIVEQSDWNWATFGKLGGEKGGKRKVEKTIYPVWDERGKTEALTPLDKRTITSMPKSDKLATLEDKGTVEDFALSQSIKSEDELRKVLFGDKATAPKIEVKEEVVIYDVKGKDMTKQELLDMDYSEKQIQGFIDDKKIKVK